MMKRPISLADWLDARTGYRAGLRHLLDEPIPGDANWWFTLGSVLVFLIVVQFVTGATLTMYFGRVLRGLHFFGASFLTGRASGPG